MYRDSNIWSNQIIYVFMSWKNGMKSILKERIIYIIHLIYVYESGAPGMKDYIHVLWSLTVPLHEYI